MSSTSSPKFQVYKTGKSYRFRLKAKNGKIILTGEKYTTKQNCIKGVKSVQKNALQDNSYEERKSKDNKYYFTLKASNGEVIGFSQMYTNTFGRNTGIASVKKNAPKAVIEDLT